MGDSTLLEREGLRAESLRLCEREFPACLGLLERLVACRSLSGSEGECADALMSYFEKRGIPAVKDARGSVLAVSAPPGLGAGEPPADAEGRKAWLARLLALCDTRGLPVLAYNAHMDVVGPGDPDKWSCDPFRACRRDGRIYGRGTCDMKGALAAMASSLALMRELDAKFERSAPVLGCFVTEEEVAEGLAFKELCEEFELRPSLVLLGEPSGMVIARGQRGKLEFSVDTCGRSVHTSVPEEGKNAAYDLARVLLSIEKFDEEERSHHGLAPENTLKRTTLAATNIRSWPEGRSFVPERARVFVTARTALGTRFADIRQRLESSELWPEAEASPVVYSGSSYTGKSGEWASDHPAWETPIGHSFLELLSNACAEILGRREASKIWPFSTDGVYSSGMAGIPTLGLGPGQERCAHIADEWVGEDELREALKVYTYLAFRLS
jgi:putative selenium metabolism hydrolase